MKSSGFRSLLGPLLLLASLLALLPVAGTALCLGDRGHVSIELIGTDCAETGNDAACMSECQECEDIPLSVGIAKGTAFRYEAPLVAALLGPSPALDFQVIATAPTPHVTLELPPRDLVLTSLRC
jgi:hypothetical protein